MSIPFEIANLAVPRRSASQNRPADVIGAAVMVARIATIEMECKNDPADDGKDQAAVALGVERSGADGETAQEAPGADRQSRFCEAMREVSQSCNVNFFRLHWRCQKLTLRVGIWRIPNRYRS